MLYKHTQVKKQIQKERNDNVGSIYHINKRPETWPVTDKGIKLKPELGGEPLIEVIYGIGDDDYDGPYHLAMLMRESIYKGLLSKQFHVDTHNAIDLIILDSKNNPVTPIEPDTIY